MALLSMSVGKLSGERVFVEVEETRTVAEVMRLLEMRFDWSPILALVKDGGGQLFPKTRLKTLRDEGLLLGGVLHTTVVHGHLEDQCYKHRYGAALRGPKGLLHVMLRDCQWSCPGDEVIQLCANQDSFVALRADGEVLTLTSDPGAAGTSHLKLAMGTRSLCSTDGAIAALLMDGRVQVWGDAMNGGNVEEVREQLVNIQQVSSTRGAFAALTAGGDVVVWGNRRLGGRVSSHVSKVQQLQANDGAFAALTEQGTVVCWGSSEHGGACELQLTSVEEIYSSYKAFSARCANGQVWSWGGHLYAQSPLPGPHVERHLAFRRVVGSNGAFAAVLSDSRVISWGVKEERQGFEEVQDELYDLQDLRATSGAFCALRDDGHVVCWGTPSLGGVRAGSAPIVGRSLVSTLGAFGVLRVDGGVTSWGHPLAGGRATEVVQRQLTQVVELSSTEVAFTALREDGVLVRWGHPHYTKRRTLSERRS